jgi:acyl-CoA thioester hydrolase
VAHVYTAEVRVRHDELDCFGRVRPGVYLRYLAQAAVDASTAVGLDAAWYARAGTRWLVRRSTFAIVQPVGAGERLEVRTWVEDFRRVRSHRGYELRDRRGAVRLTARTDWVYVDAASGRPRRIPEEAERAFGSPPTRAAERPGWSAPLPPATPASARYRVRYADLDSLGHMNNAAYVDMLVEVTLDALAGRGWPLATLAVDGRVPLVVGGDIEYREPARHGDILEIRTWFSAGAELGVHQEVVRAGDARGLVRASMQWRWMDVARGLGGPVPADVLGALGSLAA